MVASAWHSKVARLSLISGQPPAPRLKATVANLSSLRVAKWRASASCSAPRRLTLKWPERVKPENDEALRLRLHSTSGGSSETAAKELAVRPTRSCSGVQVATTTTPVANRPSACLRPTLSKTSPVRETTCCVMPSELPCSPPCPHAGWLKRRRSDRGPLPPRPPRRCSPPEPGLSPGPGCSAPAVLTAVKPYPNTLRTRIRQNNMLRSRRLQIRMAN